jgi:hypothetical protein
MPSLLRRISRRAAAAGAFHALSMASSAASAEPLSDATMPAAELTATFEVWQAQR